MRLYDYVKYLAVYNTNAQLLTIIINSIVVIVTNVLIYSW